MKRITTLIIMLMIATTALAGRYPYVGDGVNKGAAGYDVRAYSVTGDGATDDRANIATADTAVNTAGGVLVFTTASGSYKISSNISIASVCEFKEGGVLSPDNGVTVTLSNAIIAGNYQIFDISSGGIIALSNSAVNEIQPEWFGAATVSTITDADATPSVAQGRIFKTANTGATSITDFTGGITGQLIRVIVNDANTTFDFTSSGLKGNGGVDWTASVGDSLSAIYDGTDWWCSVGSGFVPLINGTVNQIIVTDNGDGSITLSTPQDIHTGATPTFAGLTLSGLDASKIVLTDGVKALTTAAFTSALLAGQVSDETGSGFVVFGTSPIIGTPTLTLQDGNGAAPTADGQIKFDRTTERLQVGDGVATNEYYTGPHTIDAVLFVAGTVNQVIVTDDGDDTITLSTPQDTHTGATPTFAGLTIGVVTWNTGDYIEGTSVNDADYGDITIASSIWTVEDDSHNHTGLVPGAHTHPIAEIDVFTSAQFAPRVSDETGVDLMVFATQPVFTGDITVTSPSILAVLFDSATGSDTDYWMGIDNDGGGDDDDPFQIGKGGTKGVNPFLWLDKDGKFGIGDEPERAIDSFDGTDPQLRLTRLDDTDFVDFEANDDGDLVIDPTGGEVIIGDVQITDTGTELIDITPSSTIAGSITWKGIDIVGGALDPSGANSVIYGVNVDISGVSLANDPDLYGFNIIMPASYSGVGDIFGGKITGNGTTISFIEGDFAIHIDDGKILIDFTAPNTAETLHHMFVADLNVSLLPATSLIHVLDVSVIGTTSGEIAAVGTFPGVEVIHQHTGVPAIPNQVNYAARWPSGGGWTAGIDSTQIMVANNDEIFIGSPNLFDALFVDLSVFASKDVKPKYYYYDISPTWIQFFPADTTDGWRADGIVEWNPLTFVNWKSDYNPGGGGAGYFIKVKRTRASALTPPTVTTVKILASTTFGWDENADLTINSLDVNGTNITGEPKHFRFNLALPGTLYDSDTEWCIVPETDAAITVSKITVSLNGAGNEIQGDLKYADTFIGLASAVVINVFDTTSGVLEDDSITSGSVAAGKAIYVSFDADPDDAITQAIFDVEYSYD